MKNGHILDTRGQEELVYEYIPEKNVKRSRAVVMALIIGAVALVAITSFIPDLPFFGVLQTLFLAVAGIEGACIQN